MRRFDGSELWPDLSDALLDKLHGQYRVTGEPLEIDMRRDVDWVNLGERLTHPLHPYPARVIRHIPILFLQSSRYTKPNDLAVDPFCGSGTVLLEALVAGRRAVGGDANPLARLISRVKVRPVPEAQLLGAIAGCLARLPTKAEPPDFLNRDYWFTTAATAQMANLRAAVEEEPDVAVRDFLRVCMSATVRRASLADPRVSVPVRLRRNQYPPGHRLHASTNARLDSAWTHDAITDFESIARENARRVGALAANGIRSAGAVVTSEDARIIRAPTGRRLSRGSAALVLTSPPYLGAQKYIRASSLSLGWLGDTQTQSLKALEDRTIGREHFRKADIRWVGTGVALADTLIDEVRAENPLRAHIASTYLIEMRDALGESHRILRAGGTLVMVTGNNRLCGRPFHTTRYLTQIALDLGFQIELELVDAIRSRGLMTRRNASAAVIETEAVTVLRKRGKALE